MRRIVDSGCNWIVINHWLLNGRLLRNCSARGIGVMAWTVNDPLRARDYLTDRRIGVIITDYPMRTRRIRDALDDRTTIAVARATRPEYRPMPASPR